MQLGAALAEELGLGWNSRRVIERCRNKAVMKEHLRRTGRIRVNAGAVVRDAAQARAFQRRVGSWPIVVKPTGGAGSEHVFFARHEADLLRRCQQVLGAAPARCCSRSTSAASSTASTARSTAPATCWRPTCGSTTGGASHGFDNLYFETTTVAASDPRFGQLADYAARVVEALGLRRAPIHLEVKVDAKGPCIIEIGARLAGGNLPVLASRCTAAACSSSPPATTSASCRRAAATSTTGATTAGAPRWCSACSRWRSRASAPCAASPRCSACRRSSRPAWCARWAPARRRPSTSTAAAGRSTSSATTPSSSPATAGGRASCCATNQEQRVGSRRPTEDVVRPTPGKSSLLALLLALATAVSAAGQPADLQLSKSDSPDPVAAGGPIIYDIVMFNAGPDNSQFVSIEDTLPAGTTFVNLIVADPTSTCSTPAVGSGGTVSCSKDALEVDGRGPSLSSLPSIPASRPGP